MTKPQIMDPAAMRFLPIAIFAVFLTGCATASSVHEAKVLCAEGQPRPSAWARARASDPCLILDAKSVEGMGTVVAVERAQGRVIVDHQEIPRQMPAMVMSYAVTPAALLEALTPGEAVRFTIDADRRAIVHITPTAQ